MYVLTQNDQVILGPIQWNSRMFESAIEDDAETLVKIAPSDKDLLPLVYDNGVKIRLADEVRPEINAKIQCYDGPAWAFTDTVGTATYFAVDKNIDLVRGELKNILAAERYRREVAGTTAVIQGQTVTVDTMRGTRDVFVQQFLLLPDTGTSEWKFPEGWLVLTKSDLGACVAAGVSHVQSQFGWEALLVAQIDAAPTLTELDALEIIPPVVVEQPLGV